MVLSLLLIIVGAVIYVHAFGWTIDVALNWNLYWSAALVLLGLVLLMREI